ncbi:hypothetical protein H490_0101595 [Leucobacter sp. UCD-THU]|uniref:DUF3846 domain-containing protein n=1 Tax=Leucobacter sp. UCD-THU TaxID=1292023 RepID=UPI000369E93E|nr:DUF3846 domain-containing protein [Leucobacter sp. UCD-THU]EYT56581.1 hypothetical protein H490_0101595 [Leucobacter sp. UCD-THU]
MSTSTLNAILITPGRTRPVSIPVLEVGERIRYLIGCDVFDVVGLEEGIDLFVDDEGLLEEQPELNLAATVVAHQLGAQSVLFGSVVAVGVDAESGETVGLTAEQMRRVLDAMRTKPSREVLERLCESLAPFESVVQLLRAHG